MLPTLIGWSVPSHRRLSGFVCRSARQFLPGSRWLATSKHRSSSLATSRGTTQSPRRTTCHYPCFWRTCADWKRRQPGC